MYIVTAIFGQVIFIFLLFVHFLVIFHKRLQKQRYTAVSERSRGVMNSMKAPKMIFAAESDKAIKFIDIAGKTYPAADIAQHIVPSTAIAIPCTFFSIKKCTPVAVKTPSHTMRQSCLPIKGPAMTDITRNMTPIDRKIVFSCLLLILPSENLRLTVLLTLPI